MLLMRQGTSTSEGNDRPPDLKEIDAEVDRLNKEKEEAVANQDFEKAAALRDQADKLKRKNSK